LHNLLVIKQSKGVIIDPSRFQPTLFKQDADNPKIFRGKKRLLQIIKGYKTKLPPFGNRCFHQIDPT